MADTKEIEDTVRGLLLKAGFTVECHYRSVEQNKTREEAKGEWKRYVHAVMPLV